VMCFYGRANSSMCYRGNKVDQGFFWHYLDQNPNCAYPIEGATRESISTLKQREYVFRWHKVVDLLTHDGHLLFRVLIFDKVARMRGLSLHTKGSCHHSIWTPYWRCRFFACDALPSHGVKPT
jgi:hypothetical protein